MPSFPLFISLSGRRVLVVGAGNVASRKIEKLLLFGPRIDVVARAASDEVLAWQHEGRLSLTLREFEMPDLDGAELVFIAADDIPLQQRVFAECQARRVPCNSVDSPDYCSFTFPALVVDGEVTFGISTGGLAPGVAGQLRGWLERVLPPGLGQVVAEVQRLRASPEVRALASADERGARVGATVRSLLATWANQPPRGA